MSAARLFAIVSCVAACASWSNPQDEDAPMREHHDDEGERFVLVSFDAPWYRARDSDETLPRMRILAAEGPRPVVEMLLGELHGDRVLVHPTRADGGYCSPWLRNPDPNGITLDVWVDRGAIVPALAERTTLEWGDGTSLVLRRGVAVYDDGGLAVAQGLVLSVTLPTAALDVSYRREEVFDSPRFSQSVPADRPLRYGFDRVAHGVAPHGLQGASIHVGLHDVAEADGRTLAVVRNDCASLVADVGTPESLGGPGHGTAWSSTRWPREEMQARSEQVSDRLRDDPGELHGSFAVIAAIAYWMDGHRAGIAHDSHFAFPPRVVGDRWCFEQVLAPGLVQPICFDREKVVATPGTGDGRMEYEVYAWPPGGERTRARTVRALERRLDEVRDCHVDMGAAARRVWGRISLELEVRADGRVTMASLPFALDDVALAETAACVARAATRWRMPAAKLPYRTHVQWSISR
jgi:hypothetical protein